MNLSEGTKDERRWLPFFGAIFTFNWPAGFPSSYDLSHVVKNRVPMWMYADRLEQVNTTVKSITSVTYTRW